jgi:hypothetical protein
MKMLEPTTTEELVQRFAPHLAPRFGEVRIATHVLAFAGSFTLAILPLSAFRVIGPTVTIVVSASLISGAVVAELVARRSYRTTLARFYRELNTSPGKLYAAVAAQFEREIERQRARTLGPESEWDQARKPLEAAAQEAARSVAYWERRYVMDQANEVVLRQRETALRLDRKFQRALTHLHARAHILARFFNECEARLAVLQSATRDYDEARKLDALAERADEVVADAQRTLTDIGSTFVTEAIRVGNALGRLERAGWLGMANAVSVDKIETLADRILDSSLHERDTLEQLTREVLS